MRKPGEIILFAYSEEKGLASFTPVPADRDNATADRLEGGNHHRARHRH